MFIQLLCTGFTGLAPDSSNNCSRSLADAAAFAHYPATIWAILNVDRQWLIALER